MSVCTQKIFGIVVFVTLIVLAILALLVFISKQGKIRQEQHSGGRIESFADSTWNATTKTIPRRVWTFWNDTEGGGIPDLVQKCIAGWKTRAGTGTSIVVVTPGTISRYISAEVPDTFGILSNAMKADWVRCALLAEHGGVWMDASVILTRSLDESFFRPEWTNGAEYVGFYIKAFTEDKFEKKSPVIENWIMACPAPVHGGTKSFMQCVFDEFNYLCKKFGPNGQAYLDEVREKRLEEYGVKYEDVIQKINQPTYLLMHVGIQIVLQTAPEFMRKDWQMRLWSAESSAFLIHVRHGWDLEAMGRDIICEDMDKLPYKIPGVIKLRGVDRQTVEKVIASGCSNENSVYKKFLGA